jgi:hypothetical protein
MKFEGLPLSIFSTIREYFITFSVSSSPAVVPLRDWRNFAILQILFSLEKLKEHMCFMN